MSLTKILFLIGFMFLSSILAHNYFVGIEKDKAYNQGYEDGMIAISPDYCLKEFSQNDKKKFRYIQRQYCKGISK